MDVRRCWIFGALLAVASASWTAAQCPDLALSPTSLPDATGLTAYGPVAFSVLPAGVYTFTNTGALPAGLTLSLAGVLTGSPTQVGSFVPRIVATRSDGCLTTQTMPLGVVPPVTLPSIRINEVHARPAAGAVGDANGDDLRDAVQDEFVEIMNDETSPLNLGGWVIRTGSTPPAPVQFTFPPNTILAAGGRAVVFGGGVPSGSFGGALTFVSGGLVLVDAPASYSVTLESAANAGFVLDSFTYDSTTFGSSCTTSCASQVRSPEGTGAFVAHTTASGNPGVLWSPGVAAIAAIPKLNTSLSSPAQGSISSVLAPIDIQFNMFMNTADFDNTRLRLFASPCSGLANEITSFSFIGVGSGPSQAQMLPSGSLAYATPHCVSVDSGVRSAIGVGLGTSVTYGFTTRPAASAPASSVVLSEYGGCRMSSTTGTTACGGMGANDEFVEIYNPTASPVDLSGWFIQRRSAGGSATCSATIPSGVVIAPNGFYLIGGAGYVASHYPGSPSADLTGAGSLATGVNESLLLISSAGTCTGSAQVVDSVSVGVITDTLGALALPPFPTPVPDGTSVERKACYDSTADASGTGMLLGGGHELQGNSEKFGASNVDWIIRGGEGPKPQNSASAVEVRTCN